MSDDEEFMTGSRVPWAIAGIKVLCRDIFLAEEEAGYTFIQHQRSLDFKDLTLEQLNEKLVEMAAKLVWFIENENTKPPY